MRAHVALPMLALAVVVALVLSAIAHVRAEAADTLQMAVRPGFAGAAKIGTWVPVEIELQNTGSEVHGEVQILVHGQTNRGSWNRPPVAYSAPVTLPDRSRKRLALGVYVPGVDEKIEAQLISSGQTLLQQEVKLDRVLATELFCGVMAGNRNGLDFLTTLDLSGQQRRVRLAHLDPIDVPAAPHLLQSLDCLVLANISTSGLSPSQKESVHRWVEAGGLLVVGGGAGAQKTLGPLSSDLLPVKVTGSMPVRSLDQLAAFVGHPLPERGSWLVGNAVVTDGVPVLEQDGVPVLVAAARGQGGVVYLGLDPSAEPLRSWEGAEGLWRHVLSYAPAPRPAPNNLARQYAGWGRIPRFALSDLTGASSASVSWLIYLLAGYTIVVGPVNYLSLRRLGHLEWSIVTIPLITLVAAGGALVGARANPTRDLVVNNLTILRSWDGQVALARTYTGLFSLREQTPELRFPEGALTFPVFYPFPIESQNSPPSWSATIQQGSSSPLAHLALRPGSLGTVSVDHVYRLPGNLTSDLVLEEKRVRGSVTSRLPHAIRHAAVVVGGEVVRLGDLSPGATKSVDVELVAPTMDLASVTQQLYPSNTEPPSKEEAAVRDLLQSSLNPSFTFGTRVDLSPVTLVGWLDGAPLGELTRSNRTTSLQRTLLISNLSLRARPGVSTELPRALAPRRSLWGSGGVRERDGQLTFSNGDSVVWEYQLPFDRSRFAVEEVRFDLVGAINGGAIAGNSVGALSSYSQAHLFDWQRGEWVAIDLRFGENRLDAPQRYVSPLGLVRFRYTLRTPPSSSGSTTVSFTVFELVVRGRGR